MGGKINKKTKDDLADFFLGNDKADSSQQKTSVLDKTSVLPTDDKTKSIVKNESSKKIKPEESSIHTKSIVPPTTPPQSKESIFSKDNIDPSLFSLEAALKQSELLRIAQGKVKSLEKQVDDLKSENETLSASAIILQKKYDQLVHKLDTSSQDQKARVDNYKDEILLKDRIIKELEKEKDILQRKNDEFQSLMNEKIQHVRVRERELQNRLEILQHEGDVVITTKDEIILDLKKQMDQLHFEMDSYKTQARELNQEIQDQKDQIRRSTKALRLALTLLENEGLATEEIRKTGTD